MHMVRIGNPMIAPVQLKQTWRIWLNTWPKSKSADVLTTIKRSTTKPCAYSMGETVDVLLPLAFRQDLGWRPNTFIQYSGHCLPEHHPGEYELFSSNLARKWKGSPVDNMSMPKCGQNLRTCKMRLQCFLLSARFVEWDYMRATLINHRLSNLLEHSLCESRLVRYSSETTLHVGPVRTVVVLERFHCNIDASINALYDLEDRRMHMVGHVHSPIFQIICSGEH